MKTVTVEMQDGENHFYENAVTEKGFEVQWNETYANENYCTESATISKDRWIFPHI